MEIETKTILFDFENFDNWCDTAKGKYGNSGYHSHDLIAIDNKNRVCRCGREFMRARDEKSFPVTVHLLD